jgi:type I restriction enzyme, S subunit
MRAHTTNGHWPVAALADVATIERDSVQPERIISGTLYVGLENIDPSGSFTGVRAVDAGELESNKFSFGPQHILYGKLRPYLRKIVRPDFEGICSTDILPILPGPKLDRGFLYHYLRQPRMVDLATARSAGANLPRLSPAALAAFQLPLPPLAEQRWISEVLDKTDALRAKRRQAIAKLDTLLHAVFMDMFGDPAGNAKGWPVVSLAEVTEKITDGVHLKPDYVRAGVPFISVKDISSGRLDFSDCKYISREAHEILIKRCNPEPGDVLYTKVGTYGIPAVVDQDREFSLYVSVCLSSLTRRNLTRIS